jgi:hypothetical protein
MDYFSFSDPGWARIEDPGALFARIGPVDGRLPLGPHVAAAERSLPMYEGVRIYALTSPAWEPRLAVCYLAHGDTLIRLNGTSPGIHGLNAEAPLRLTAENVLYYLSFFCFFVRGEQGPFYLVHGLDDDLLPPGFADATSENAGGRSPGQLFRRPRLHGTDEKGSWRVSGLVHYSNAVFMVHFLVQPTGMVEMLDDMPLMADLPCRVDAPLAPRAQPA